MKNNRILFFFVLLEICTFLALVIFFEEVDIKSIWFSLLLVLIGIYSLLYAFLYSEDAEIYFGFLVLFIGIVSAIQFKLNYNFTTIYPAYIFCFAMGNLAVFVFFRQKIHLKLFAILFSISILIAGYKMNFLKLYQLLIVVGIIVILAIISSVFRLRKNLRRSK